MKILWYVCSYDRATGHERWSVDVTEAQAKHLLSLIGCEEEYRDCYDLDHRCSEEYLLAIGIAMRADLDYQLEQCSE